jgi:translation elongation factor EF-1beta
MVLPSDEEMDPDALITMVREINASSVDIGDRLSNNIYRYEKDEGIKLVK